MSIVKMNRLFEIGSIPKHDYCVYRLMGANKSVIYVGQTSNMERRLYEHLSNGKEFLFFECVPCEKEDATSIEADEIVKHNPELNIMLPKTEKYRTMSQARARIASAIKEANELQTDKIMKLIRVAFKRPQNKKMTFTYVLTEDVDRIVSEIRNEVKIGVE